MPCYFSVAVLAATIATLLGILTLRELHHNRIQAGLIDKILEQHGLNAIPHEHPLAEIVSTIQRKADTDEANKKEPERVRIPIPGMAAFSQQYRRVIKAKEQSK